LKTYNKIFEKDVERTWGFSHKDIPNREQDILHAALGLSGEVGEVCDVLKKSLAVGKPIDEENLLEELGDVAYYVFIILNRIGRSLSEAQKKNIAKRAVRFPRGFSEDRFDRKNRNLTQERKAQDGQR